MKHRIIDHTADLRLEIFGGTEAALFENACSALFDTLAEKAGVRGEYCRTLQVSGLDLPDLLFNWLRELLALWTVEEKLVAAAKMVSIKETALSARVDYDDYDPGRHRLKREIKAVTYHDLQVFRKSGKWRARVVVDV